MSEENLSPLVQSIKRFNRKERYWLLENVLQDFSTQKINKKLIDKIESEFNISIPDNGVYWALDYHFDWLYAALTNLISPAENNEYENKKNFKIVGNQQDIDFLICFDKTIIFIEAKGVTSWGSKQLNSKINRLEEVFNFFKEKYPEEYSIYLILMSPHKNGDNIIKNKLNNNNENKRILENIKHFHNELLIEKNLKKVTRVFSGNEYSSWIINN